MYNQNVRPALDPNCLTLVKFLKKYFKSGLFFKKKSAGNKKESQITQNAKQTKKAQS